MTTLPTSRNDPCPCGSGRRYKACHGALASIGAAPTPDAAAPDRHADALLDGGDFVGAAPPYTAMQMHVINLDRSVARLDEFRRWNAHMPEIERFAAIDGAAVDRQQLLERNIISEDLRYTDAALGCALSHLFFWEQASTKSAVITVCEDDAILHGSFRDIAPRLIGALPEDWDIVVWGWNFDSILFFDLIPGGISPCLATFNQEQLRSTVRAFQSHPLSPQLFRLFRAFGAVCYSISASGSRRLLERSVPIRNFALEVPMVNPALPNVGVDIVMSAAYPSLNAFVSFPPLAVTKNDHAVSTIRGSSLPGNQE